MRRGLDRSDLIASLGLLALIMALALGGLALEGNGRKFLRVLLGFVTYAAILLGLFRGRASEARERLPFWPFAQGACPSNILLRVGHYSDRLPAGAAAELVSGWLRPFPSVRVVFATAPVAALLIGGVHWLAVRTWRPLREWITRGRDRDRLS